MNIQCPYCCTVLELPDESVGWKVQCVYCNEKFIATEEFIRKQREALKKKTIRLGPVKRQAENSGIVIKRSTRTSPEISDDRRPTRKLPRIRTHLQPAVGGSTTPAVPAPAAPEVVPAAGEKMEVTPDVPFWFVFPDWLIAVTMPLWLIPFLLYLMFQELNPFAESEYDRRKRLGLDTKDLEDETWTYAERDRWQWILGIDRYANKD